MPNAMMRAYVGFSASSNRRLQALLDKQDGGEELTEEERSEAEKLVESAELLSLHRLRGSMWSPTPWYSADMMKGDDLLTSALTLPADERARIAHELLQSLDNGEDFDVAGAWHQELERRAREVDEGTAVLEDWTTVRTQLAARAAQRR